KYVMPYKILRDLPDRVRENLPEHAQEIYMEAFNNAWNEYANPEDHRGEATREETAHKVAWSAVKQSYEKDERTGEWKKKGA
ncbi:MAG TPA: ChaB family protein, partial [Methanotrichaceae archaeon]|nr:ChaB family protein [Methanotrichaceae archaeon]